MDGTPPHLSPTQGVLSGAWDVYKAHFAHFATIALAVYVVVSVLGLVLAGLLGIVGALLAAIISVVGIFWLQGAYVKAVEDVRDGRVDLSVGDTFRGAQPYIGTVAIAGILAGIGIFIGLLLLLVPGLFLMTIWSVLVPVIVLEDRSVGEAFGRSRELVKGHGWNVFGLIVLTVLILVAASIVIGLVLSPLPERAQAFLADLVSGVIVGPFVAIAWTLLYFGLVGRGAPPAAGELGSTTHGYTAGGYGETEASTPPPPPDQPEPPPPPSY